MAATRPRRGIWFEGSIERTGAYDGLVSVDSSFIDKTGAYARRVDALGQVFEKEGALIKHAADRYDVGCWPDVPGCFPH